MNTEKPPDIDYSSESKILKNSGIIFEKDPKSSISKEPTDKIESNTIITPNKNTENLKENSKCTIQINKNRCWGCNKRVGYTGMECRCNYIFCGNCRYPEQHSCTFDFRAHGRKILEKQNKKIENNQLEEI
jgi:hypothetical protein